MAKNRKPLGRGLSNLLPAVADSFSGIQGTSEYQELPLSVIAANPNQPRKRFEKKELEELAETLCSVGLIEPVVVRRIGEGQYQLIAGERRFRAAQLAGFKKIPTVLKQANDLQALEIGIIENIQREELNPIEEARSYAHWMEVTQQKADVLAKKVGKDRSTVKNLTRILKLPLEVLELIEKRELSVGQARPLLGIGNKKQLTKLALKIAKEGWTSRRVEDEAARLMEPFSPSQKRRRIDPNVADLEKELRTRLGAKVQVLYKKRGGGKIILHYGNLKDLERILEIINVR